MLSRFSLIYEKAPHSLRRFCISIAGKSISFSGYIYNPGCSGAAGIRRFLQQKKA